MDDPRERFGSTILGPIFYGFCLRLHEQIEHHSKAAGPDGTTVLYVSRAGLRLEALYRKFRTIQGVREICAERHFYVSRISVAKACFNSDPTFVADVIAREFSGASLGALVEHVTRGRVRPTPTWANREASASSLLALMAEPHEDARRFKDYFTEQASLFREYLASLLDQRTSIILVDSGWTANTQWMLMRTFPAYTWQGLYVGKWDYRDVSPAHFKFVHGLVVDSANVAREPSQAIIRHHHIIEQPLEPPCASVEEYRRDGARVRSNTLEPDEGILLRGGAESAHFRGILRYFSGQQVQSRKAILDHLERAVRLLRRSILFPTMKDITAMNVDDRSADFGKRLRVPVLLAPAARKPGQRRFPSINRLRVSLWTRGQLVLEYPRLSQIMFLGGRLWYRLLDRAPDPRD